MRSRIRHSRSRFFSRIHHRCHLLVVGQYQYKLQLRRVRCGVIGILNREIPLAKSIQDSPIVRTQYWELLQTGRAERPDRSTCAGKDRTS
jgi:hypothetical protein